MTCEEAMAAFDELDRDEHIPREIADHLRTCESCRTTVERMSVALGFLSDASTPGWARSAEFSASFSASVMERIQSEQQAAKNPVWVPSTSIARWLVAGIVIFAAMPLVSFSNSFKWLNGTFGTRLNLPVHLVLGIIVVVYSLLFIGSHLSEVSKWLHLKQGVVRRKPG